MDIEDKKEKGVKEVKLRQLIALYGMKNILEWIEDDLDNNNESNSIAVEILLLPELTKLSTDEIKNITFKDWLKLARIVQNKRSGLTYPQKVMDTTD